MSIEAYFIEEIQKNKIIAPLQILNLYRNFYYTENSNTERGIVARAINDLFMEYDWSEGDLCE